MFTGLSLGIHVPKRPRSSVPAQLGTDEWSIIDGGDGTAPLSSPTSNYVSTDHDGPLTITLQNLEASYTGSGASNYRYFRTTNANTVLSADPSSIWTTNQNLTGPGATITQGTVTGASTAWLDIGPIVGSTFATARMLPTDVAP